MLDYRIKTFLTVLASGSFTKAAERLHITQPAVSQQIKYLEDRFGCKLIDTGSRKISPTAQGQLLKEYAATVLSDSTYLIEKMQAGQTDAVQFAFGATLSIGEYVMPEILSRLLLHYPEMRIHMSVANTQVLLQRLNEGELNFVVVEGLFDKLDYDTTLFSRERFVPVCCPDSDLAKGPVDLDILMGSRLILREKGSGTREILEHILHKNNYSLHAFERIIEIGNMTAIEEMVSHNAGITFLFEAAARKKIKEGKLAIIDMPGFDEHYEFNFVMLKNSFFTERYMKILELLTEHRIQS